MEKVGGELAVGLITTEQVHEFPRLSLAVTSTVVDTDVEVAFIVKVCVVASKPIHEGRVVMVY